MGRELSYTPAEVTRALTLLAINGGDCARTATELREDDENPIEMRASTLRAWRKETHVEQYRRLVEETGAELEERATQRARTLIDKADTQLERLIERAGDAQGDQVPATLRAVADVKAKSGNLLMQLTGRPTNPRDNSTSDIVELLKHMADRGYLNLAPDVQDAVEGTAEPVDD